MQSFLDTELYKLTLQQAVRRCFPRAAATYRLETSRHVRLPSEFAVWLTHEVAAWSNDIVCTEAELEWLAHTGFFTNDYLESLARFRYDTDQLEISVSDGGSLRIEVRGLWQSTVLWEVPLLAAISALYHERVDTAWKSGQAETDYARYTRRKADHLLANGCAFGEFGTRKRHSPAMQEAALRACRDADHEATKMDGAGFLGTSNLHFARTLRLPLIGAMAHEWVMAHSVFSGLEQANRDSLLRWMQIYGKRGGIAPTDTYTSALFFENFARVLAESFPALAHDSGDPYQFIRNALTFYDLRGIDPREKTLLFSDCVGPDAAIAIRQATDRQTNVAFSLPTQISDNASRPLELELKLAEVNGQPVCKLSDDPHHAAGPSELVHAAARKVARRTCGSAHFTPSSRSP